MRPGVELFQEMVGEAERLLEHHLDTMATTRNPTLEMIATFRR